MLSRALGALYGLAIGDALGMPVQSLSRAEILAHHGPLIGEFCPGPDGHPLAAGRGHWAAGADVAARISWATGLATGLTQHQLIETVYRLVVAGGGKVDAADLAHDLLAWEESMRARGSLDLLGPSTRQALAALAAGADVTEAGRAGLTNGAAMRITPVGIATASRHRGLLEDRVVAASRLTHNTGVALAGAAAIAMAVSAGIDGDPLPVAISRAVAAAAGAAGRGHWAAGADVAARISWATGLAQGLGQDQLIETVYRLVGTSLATQESVPAAFAVAAACPGDPWLACRIAASLGGDSDTIAAMTGAICGACHGAGAFPDAARRTVARVNGLDLDPLADDLLALRTSGHD